MRYNSEKEFQTEKEKIDFQNDRLHDFFCVYVSSRKYDRLLVFQTTPVPKIYFKDMEIPYEDLIIFLESLEINNNYKIPTNEKE